MTTRRNFLKTAGFAASGLLLAGASGTMLQAQNTPQSQGEKRKVNVAFIGIGNRGWQVINDFAGTDMINVAALCDIDLGAEHTLDALKKYPKAKQFQDFRVMFDKAGKEFEAVIICTPDFSHFPIAMLAIANGKHVYVEKPMARTFLETELMMAAARKNPNIVTQVGNQGHSDANYFQFKTWVEQGIIKDVTAVTAHMNNPRRWHTWDPNIYKYPEAQPIPRTLDWLNWHTTRPYHDYNEKYHKGEWRSWFDFGMGALGDWGAHILDTVHEFLELGLPYEVNPVKLTGHNDFFFPMSSTILFRFPQRNGLPPCDVTWYDGVDNLPPIPAGYGASELAEGIPASGAGEIEKTTINPGKIIYGRDLTFKGASHGSTLSIIPAEKAREMQSKLPEIPKSPSNHFENFLLACRGLEKTRSPFEIHGTLNQVFTLGVMAQRLNSKLYFDARTKEITNNAFANAMLTGVPPRKGWEDYYKI